MGTRSAILRPGITSEIPEGRYCHWDGYPDGVGAELFHAIRDHFKGDIEAALKFLIDDHPAGWSAICGRDWSLEPGFEDDNEEVCVTCGRRNWEHYKQYYAPRGVPLPPREPGADELGPAALFGHRFERDYSRPRSPECYCHGSRSEEAWEITLQNAAGSGCEYAYVISPEKRVMYVLSSYCEDGEKMIGMFGMGDENATWKLLAEVDLDGNEPDWDKLEG